MKLGQYEYDGNGKLLDNDIEYTVFAVGSAIEAYPENGSEPVEMNKGAFTSMLNGNLRKVEGYTPMR